MWRNEKEKTKKEKEDATSAATATVPAISAPVSIGLPASKHLSTATAPPGGTTATEPLTSAAADTATPIPRPNVAPIAQKGVKQQRISEEREGDPGGTAHEAVGTVLPAPGSGTKAVLPAPDVAMDESLGPFVKDEVPVATAACMSAAVAAPVKVGGSSDGPEFISTGAW